MIESFPLSWPEGWKKTPVNLREKSQFRRTTNDVRNFLKEEVRRLGANRLIISTNMPTRLDGEFYATARNPDDTGMAVCFTYKKKPMCFACDRHPSLRENLHAIAATIGALRGIEHSGASATMMERAFTGFTALPAASWRSVLEVDRRPRGKRLNPTSAVWPCSVAPRRRCGPHGGNQSRPRRSVKAVMNYEL